MNYTLNSMYLKDISRDIKGVIKVGQTDDENIKQELEEYVVTDELKQHIDKFFDAYKSSIYNHTDKNGVWISGFFGSGKSHFLKILSYLLKNKSIDGKSAIQYFNDKGLDNLTLANIKASEDIPTDVILFNIDSKSESNSKLNKDAIVNVFNKVFNEMQGFCASMPWIADLERQMVKDGVYEDFKAKFEQISGNSWIESREDFYYEEDAIIEALSSTTKMSEEAARNWFNNSEENYTLSIDKFANRVKEYCDSKGKNHRIIFLVDEMGQYIGDNTQLMLNLQTVVEDLGTKCNGRCWVIVTSQGELDEFTKVRGNDFSKIQGRFNTRLSLSSANVDEVIKRRILRKTDAATSHLKLLYEQNESVIKNLLTFTTDTAEMKLYQNSEDFAEVYPFIPYQFNLLQQAFNGVREHGASGKSLSKGERSLLGAYQHVAVDYKDKDTNVLIPFSAFYNTIDTFLDGTIRSVVIHAQKNSRLNEFDIEVLKLLFLIKYVREIKSNIENIATLLVSNINDSKKELKDKVQESLSRLIRETLVQKSGDEYIFLTNDEQDVNKEIKNMNIDNGLVTQKIGEIIFDNIYSLPKYMYSKQYNFQYNKMVDDRSRGPQTNELGVKIITANYALISDIDSAELKQLSIRENYIIVNISRDVNYIEEIENVLKIEAYLRQKSGTKQSIAIEDIKVKKSRERDESSKRAENQIKEALNCAEIYVNGNLLDIKEKDAVARINDGFKAMVDFKYSKIYYITTFADNQQSLSDIINSSTTQMTLTDDIIPNKLALDEIAAHINISTTRGLSMTAKSIITKFSGTPYGWKELDIEALILRLLKKQEIRVIYNDSVIVPNDSKIVTYITKKDTQEKLKIKSREKVSTKYIQIVKDLSNDLFNITSIPTDEDSMMKRFQELCGFELQKIVGMLSNYTYQPKYPQKNILNDGKALFQSIINIKDTIEFFEVVSKYETQLLDYNDDSDYLKAFFYKKSNNSIDYTTKGEQREIFDKALDRISKYDVNKDFISDSQIDNIVKNMKNIINEEKPYSKIKDLPLLIEQYEKRIVELLENESEPIKKTIIKYKNEVLEKLNSYNASEIHDKYVNDIISDFDKLVYKVENTDSFTTIAATSKLAESKMKDWIQRIVDEMSSVIIDTGDGTSSETDGEYVIDGGGGTAVATIKTISLVNLVTNTVVLNNEKEVDEFVNKLRAKLMKELNDNQIISIS